MKASELKEMEAIAGSLLKVPSNSMIRLSDEYINRIIYLLSNGSEKIKQLQDENKQLQQRIDKAIEYIGKFYCGTSRGRKLYDIYDEDVTKLLEILKGDNNE